jgi:hypothetical protein
MSWPVGHRPTEYLRRFGILFSTDSSQSCIRVPLSYRRGRFRTRAERQASTKHCFRVQCLVALAGPSVKRVVSMSRDIRQVMRARSCCTYAARDFGSRTPRGTVPPDLGFSWAVTGSNRRPLRCKRVQREMPYLIIYASACSTPFRRTGLDDGQRAPFLAAGSAARIAQAIRALSARCCSGRGARGAARQGALVSDCDPWVCESSSTAVGRAAPRTQSQMSSSMRCCAVWAKPRLARRADVGSAPAFTRGVK